MRIAVVVSKKVHKSAVVRNRIRRRLYELARTYAKTEGVSFGSVIIVVQNDTVASIAADTLREEVTGLLQKMA